MVDQDTLRHEDEALCYPLSIGNPSGSGLRYIEPLAMWEAILGDLVLKTPAPVMAARFHKGLARIVAALATDLARRDDVGGPRFDTVALSGGCFQNRILFEEVVRRLEQNNFVVLSHAQVPANDGGLALGQAAIGAAHLIDAEDESIKPKEMRHVPRDSRPHRKDRRRSKDAGDRRCQRCQASGQHRLHC